MSTRDDDRFRPKVGTPRSRGSARGSRFVNRVLKAASKAGPTPKQFRAGKRPGSRLGRGYVASRMAGSALNTRSRRVIIKTRLVVLKTASARSTEVHLRYIERDGVTREGGRGQLYSATSDEASGNEFEEQSREDRHQFRFILSPEDATEIGDLKAFTRQFMGRMEQDLGTRLDWVAVDHWDTDNPHTHIVLRGKDDSGHDLIIASDYIAHGMRHRASELATEWLGERTEREIRETLTREMTQERWTNLDREIQRQTRNGAIELRGDPGDATQRAHRALLTGRLQHLSEMGLAERQAAGVWIVAPQAERTLRAMGERGDIIRTMQRALKGQIREYAVLETHVPRPPVLGRIAGKGLADELHDRGYLVVDGVDGRAHYAPLPAGADLADFPMGGIVELRTQTAPRPADRTIAEVSESGIYRTERHLTLARTKERHPESYVEAHVRRLEALRRAGIVERVSEGVWRIPSDLVSRGQAHDTSRFGGVTAELHSHLPIERQTRVIGATWLDRQLIAGNGALAAQGFGAETRQALHEREEFLIEQKFATRQGNHVNLGRNLLVRLRTREFADTAKGIESKTGLTHRPLVDGQRVSGIYRRSLTLASGRFAMLDDGLGFSLVPWRPIVEKRLGQSISAVIRNNQVSWDLGRARGIER